MSLMSPSPCGPRPLPLLRGLPRQARCARHLAMPEGVASTCAGGSDITSQPGPVPSASEEEGVSLARRRWPKPPSCAPDSPPTDRILTAGAVGRDPERGRKERIPTGSPVDRAPARNTSRAADVTADLAAAPRRLRPDRSPFQADLCDRRGTSRRRRPRDASRGRSLTRAGRSQVRVRASMLPISLHGSVLGVSCAFESALSLCPSDRVRPARNRCGVVGSAAMPWPRGTSTARRTSPPSRVPRHARVGRGHRLVLDRYSRLPEGRRADRRRRVAVAPGHRRSRGSAEAVGASMLAGSKVRRAPHWEVRVVAGSCRSARTSSGPRPGRRVVRSSARAARTPGRRPGSPPCRVRRLPLEWMVVFTMCPRPVLPWSVSAPKRRAVPGGEDFAPE
jgi:hypothetical protein